MPFFKTPVEESYALYRKLFSYLDCALLDVQTLQYKQRPLVLSFMYLVVGIELNQFDQEVVLRDFSKTSLFLQKQKSEWNLFFGEFMAKCFGYELSNLLPTIQYASTFFGLKPTLDYPIAAKIDPESILKGHFEDFLAYQTHINYTTLQYVLKHRERSC